MTNKTDMTYRKYIELILALHALIDQGNDNEEADSIRDEMDPFWYKLPEHARIIMSGVSQLLNEERDNLGTKDD